MKTSHHTVLSMTAIFCSIILLSNIVVYGDMKSDFTDPPSAYRPCPLWFWNNIRVTIDGIQEQMQKSYELSRYGGLAILPYGKDFQPTYLGDEYFKIYGAALAQARTLGMKMSLYDEYGWPSGSAGAPNSSEIGLFQKKYPDLTIKRLDKFEETVHGPTTYQKQAPSGALMSVVAMETETLERIDLTDSVTSNQLEWKVPAGSWRIMFFVCVNDGYRCCDYLDPDAVDKFIGITHQLYYDQFKEYFGTTILSTFFDEPSMRFAKGRVWTTAFNKKFEAKYGFRPQSYYPALWYDIGPETQAVRNYLFGFRTELYASGFPKRIQDWCDSHHIQATGHQDQEEIVNPVSISGDLMKCFKYQAIPGIDKIGGDRPAEKFYKVISSAAYNWDKSLVMSETYGAMGNLSWDEIYSIAMEQYTKGINMIIPHAVWYDDSNVKYKPELSWRNPIYADHLPEYNTFIARLNILLQNNASHICDIAVLYPISTLQGSHYFDGPLRTYKGGVEVPCADYVEVSELLTNDIGRDFTYIHPEVLDEKCKVIDNELVLPNTIHPGKFKVFILPGHETILWSNLKKIKQFYDNGGKIIATGTLPFKSAEFGHDQDVTQTIESLFGKEEKYPHTPFDIHTNANGGIAIHLNALSDKILAKALDKALTPYDVEFEGGPVLRYIHKAKNNTHIYYFANITDHPVTTQIHLRCRLNLQRWNPHTGEITQHSCTHSSQNDQNITLTQLTLDPVKSIFLVGSPAKE